MSFRLEGFLADLYYLQKPIKMETINENILIQYIDGTLPAEERSAVESWLADSGENRRTLEQVYYTLQLVRRAEAMQSVDPEQALRRLKGMLHGQKKKIALRRFFQVAQRAAALFFIPLLIASLYLFRENGKEGVAELMEVRTHAGVVSSFRLPDGTQVWLNGQSVLKYPTAFTGSVRKVELEGQGYFEVAKNRTKPFIVQADPAYAIEVLGTTFTVSAYKDDDRIETTLVEGSVKLHTTSPSAGDRTQLLKPSEKAAFLKQSGKMEIAVVNPLYDTAWKDGEIIFRNHPMAEVLKVLERHYHVRFEVFGQEPLESIITARFKDETLAQVMEYLRLASCIRYEIRKPAITDDQTLALPIVEISK